MYRLQRSCVGGERCVPIREVSSIGTKLKCPDYGGVLISEGVVLCTGFNGVELGPEDVSLLERCPLLGPN